MTRRKFCIAVLISGRGSNLKALARACQDEDFPAEIGLVLSSKAQAEGLVWARGTGLKTCVVDRRLFATKRAFDNAIHAQLQARGVDFVCAAGFMLILGADFVHKWSNRILNVHPSLLPNFPGLDTHRRAIEAGAREHGATVHIVTPEVDAGPIVMQASVPVLPDDTPETLAQRVLEVEHEIYPEAVRRFCRSLSGAQAGGFLPPDP